MQPAASKLTQALIRMAAIFERRQIKYALIGGLAVGYLGHQRATKDVDIILMIPQISLPGVLEDLKEQGFAIDLLSAIKEWNQTHLVVFNFEGMRIDWMRPLLALHQHVIDTATETIFQGQKLRIASAEGIILLKLLAFRSRDQIDIESIVAIKRTELNVDWILKEWDTVGNLDDPPMKWFREIYQTICGTPLTS